MTSQCDSVNDAHTYKPFVDGLRAIAILTVVGSHAHVPGLAGGYVGVDIFFVISGYLIINLIIADIKTGRFSVFDFYARRALRILPAFLLVMVTCLVLSTTVFVQPEHKDFAESFFFSTLMFANHHFLSHQGYFDMAAFTKPLLHMWSLGVEEQFYWMAPLILLGVTAVTANIVPENVGKIWLAVTLGLAIFSFLACVAFTFPLGRPNVSFYIMPTRGWEFILGGMVPYLVPAFRRWPSWIGDCLGLIGIAVIGLAVTQFDANSLYPSFRASVPALGAMLIILSGLTYPRNSAARILSTWPMVYIGLISYALYLWHWPLISFVRTMNYGNLNTFEATSVVALSFALAIITYLFIELPVRRWRSSHKFRALAVVSVGAAACVTVASIGYVWSLDFAPGFLPSLTGLEAFSIATTEYPTVLHHGVLLGDSHAGVLSGPFQEYARRAGSVLTIETSGGCPPLLHTEIDDARGEATHFCTEFDRKISFVGAEFLIMAARWNFYLGLPPSDTYFSRSVLAPERKTSGLASPFDVLATSLTATISKAKKSGVKRILVLGPLPEFPWNSPYCVMRSIRAGVDSCTITRASVDARRKHTMETLRRVITGFAGVRLVDPIDVFCTAEACSPHNGRKLYFYDSNHLDAAGVERLYKADKLQFLWAFNGNDARR